MAANLKETVIGALFQPVLLQGQEVINTFRAVPTITLANGTVRSGSDVISYMGDLLKTAKINSLVLDAAFSQLVKANDSGKNLRMIIPINSYSVVGNEGATLIVNSIKKLPKELRGNVIVELFDFPEEVPMSILEDVVVPLFPFFQHFVAVPPDDMEDYTVFANCNFMGVCINLERTEQGDEEANKLVTKFWASGTKRRLKLFFEGVSEPAIKETAERYEAMGIDGPIIGEPVAALDQG